MSSLQKTEVFSSQWDPKQQQFIFIYWLSHLSLQAGFTYHPCYCNTQPPSSSTLGGAGNIHYRLLVLSLPLPRGEARSRLLWYSFHQLCTSHVLGNKETRTACSYLIFKQDAYSTSKQTHGCYHTEPESVAGCSITSNEKRSRQNDKK